MCWAPVAHTCNPVTQDEEIRKIMGSKSAWANSLQDPTSKTPITKKGLVDWLKAESLSLSPSSAPHTKKKQTQKWIFVFKNGEQKWKIGPV
jgi:hypothetical protein